MKKMVTYMMLNRYTLMMMTYMMTMMTNMMMMMTYMMVKIYMMMMMTYMSLLSSEKKRCYPINSLCPNHRPKPFYQ